MRFPHLNCIAFLLLAATTTGCKSRKPGADNIRRGQELLATRPSAAIGEYERAGKAGADSIEVRKGLAAAHERLKEFDKAAKLLREVIAQKSDDLDARLSLARVEVLQQHFDVALSELESTLRRQPPNVPSLLLYAALAQNPAQGKAGIGALDGLDTKSFAPLLKSAEYAFARASLMSVGGDNAGADAVLAGAASSKSLSPPLALGLANASRAVNRLRLAEWLLAHASETEGAAEGVHEALAEVALSQRHLPLARVAISKLRTEFKPDPKALLLLAQYYELQNQKTERAQVTRRALDAVPAQDDAERRKISMVHATALARSGNAKEAAEVLANLLDREPGFPPAILLLADLRLGQQQPDESIDLASKLEKDEQLRTEAYQILVAAHLQKKAAAAAEAAARRFVSSSPGSPEAVMLLVNLLLHNRRPELALREADAYLARNPNQVDVLTARISLTERVNGFAKAEVVATEAARMKNPKIIRELARLYERNNRLDDAIRIYRELAVSEPKVLFDLSQLQDRMGKLGDALGAMRELVQADPYNVGALLRLGMLEERASQSDAARQVYERILGIDGDSVPALNNLAMLLSGTPGGSQRAVELARRAYATASNDVRIADTLGWALVQTTSDDDRREAVRLLEQSSGALRTPESDYHYAVALAATGKFAEAAAALDRAIGPNASPHWKSRALTLRDDIRRRLAEAPAQAPPP